MKKSNKGMVAVAAILIIGAGSFFGGMRYQQSKVHFGEFSRQNPTDQRSIQRGDMERGGASVASGEVVEIKEGMITLKMMDGGSRIIFVSDLTEVIKTEKGNISEIGVGEQIMVSGEQNADGSVVARSIQLSPRFAGATERNR